MSKRIIVVGVAVLLLCGGLVGFNIWRSGMRVAMFAHAGRPPVVVDAAKVQTVAWQPGMEAFGTARAQSGADLSVQAAGVVRAIDFKSGDHVSSGQLLVQIDDSAEQADMASAQANIKLDQGELARATVLRKKGYATQQTLDNAQAQLNVAQASYAHAKAISDLKAIKAPFDGVVGIADVNVGQLVPVGTVVVTLQDLDHMKVDFTIPEQSIDSVHVGQTVRFGTDPNDLPFQGQLIGIDPKVDPQTHLVAVQAQLDNSQHQVLPGEFLRVRVELGEQPGVLALPQTAVITSLYGNYVYVVSGGGQGPKSTLKAVQTFVQTGRQNLGQIEIKSGLKAGDLVITDGQNKLQNGAAVILGNGPQAADVGGAG
jgi:membrane fusion protein, multidrug efflux system